MNEIICWIKKYILGIDTRSNLEIAIAGGMKVGKNLSVQDGCSFDVSHCWLIEIGDNVTFAPRVNIIAHDASTKRELGYTLLGNVKVGSNTFVGAGTTILPNVSIGDNVVIGVGSVVTKDIPSNSVAVGNPARVISTYSDYMEKRKRQFAECKLYGIEYTLSGGIDDAKKEQMRRELQDGIAGIV